MPEVGQTVHVFNRRAGAVEGPQEGVVTFVREGDVVEVSGVDLSFIPRSTMPPRETQFGVKIDAVTDLGIPPSNGAGNEDRKWWWEWPA